MTLHCFLANKQQQKYEGEQRSERLTCLTGETLKVLKDLVQAGVQVLHPAVDMVLVLLDGIQDSSMMDNGLIQTRNTRPQTGHVFV